MGGSGLCTLPKGAENKDGGCCTLPKGAERKGRGESCTCQKEQKEKEKEEAAPCQKEQQKKVVPSKQQQVEEHKRSQQISLSPPSSPSQSQSPQPKRNRKQKDATPQSRKWVSDGSRWTTEEEASKRVAIDWHNTLSKGNNERVHWQDRDALQMLQEKGYYLILLSYSGKERAEETLNCRSRICCSSLRRWDSPGKNAAKKEKQPTARRIQSHTFLMTAQGSSMSVGKGGTHTPMPCTPGTTSTQQGIGISGRLPISFCWTKRVQHEPLPVAFKPLTKGPVAVAMHQLLTKECGQ